MAGRPIDSRVQIGSAVQRPVKPALDRYEPLQLPGFGDRSHSDRPPIHAAGRSRGRRVLRRVARVRPRVERAAVDRARAGRHGRRAGGLRSTVRARPPWRRLSPTSCTGGRAGRIWSPCSGSFGRCSIARDRWKGFSRSRRSACGRYRRRARQLLDARAGAGSQGRVRPCARAARRLLLLSAAVGRQRVQAPEPVSALDGAQGRAGSRRVDARLAGQAHRAARHARDPRRAVPAPDALHEPGLADGPRHHGVAAPARSG